jgi:hypothetical protein
MSLHLPIAILAALSVTSGDRVVGLYDEPLMVNHARSAHFSLNEARSLIQLDLSEVIAEETVTKFEKLNANIANDLRIARERVANEDVTVALEHAESRVRDWSETVVLALNPPDHGLMMLPMSFLVDEKSRIAAAALDDFVEVFAGYGFGYRMGSGGFGCCYARLNVRSRSLCSAGRADPCIFFGYSMSKSPSPQ